jgi:hypothetical protein
MPNDEEKKPGVSHAVMAETTYGLLGGLLLKVSEEHAAEIRQWENVFEHARKAWECERHALQDAHGAAARDVFQLQQRVRALEAELEVEKDANSLINSLRGDSDFPHETQG